MSKTSPPPGGIPETAEQDVAYVFTAALAFGVYLSTLVFTLRWTLFSDQGWKRRNFVNWPIVAMTLFIFALTIIYTAMDLKGVMDEVHLLRTNPSVPYNQPMWMSILKCIFANTIALSADLVLIFRCYTLYGKRYWIIAFPCFLWIGGLVCTIIQAYLQIAHSTNPNIGPYKWASINMKLGPGIALIPFWGSTALLNIYCTSLLLVRIYRASTKTVGASATVRQLRFVMRSIAESGFIYLSITLAHFFVWFSYDNFAISLISVLNVPLIGITFNLILIRAAHSRIEGFRDKTVGDVTSIEFGTNSSQTAQVHQEAKLSGMGSRTTVSQ